MSEHHGRRVTVVIEEFGGAAAGEPGAWEIKATASNDLRRPIFDVTDNAMVQDNCTMEELDERCRNTLAVALKNYRSERQRGRKRHGHKILP